MPRKGLQVLVECRLYITSCGPIDEDGACSESLMFLLEAGSTSCCQWVTVVSKPNYWVGLGVVRKVFIPGLPL